MISLILMLIVAPLLAKPCAPNELFIRAQKIQSYEKNDGTEVSSHQRSAHCRTIFERASYFQDSTKQKFPNLNTRFKKWNPKEKRIVEESFALIPAWLQEYKLTEILRGDKGGHPLNPAASAPLTKSLIIFDSFFSSIDKRAIIIHEMAHIALLNLDPQLTFEFSVASGWTLDETSLRPVPPKNPLLPDSTISINEDLANHIEIYHTNPNRVLVNNPVSFSIIQKIVETKEKQP